MIPSELRRLAEEVVARNEDGGFVIPARDVLRLLDVAEAAEKYKVSWRNNQARFLEGKLAIRDLDHDRPLREGLFAALAALEVEAEG